MNRERLQMVRDRIAAEPEERLNMTDIVSGAYDDARTLRWNARHFCKSAFCIAGFTGVVFGARVTADDYWTEQAAKTLGLNENQSVALFTPENWEFYGRYTQADALTALDSLINADSDDALPVWPRQGSSR